MKYLQIQIEFGIVIDIYYLRIREDVFLISSKIQGKDIEIETDDIYEEIEQFEKLNIDG